MHCAVGVESELFSTADGCVYNAEDRPYEIAIFQKFTFLDTPKRVEKRRIVISRGDNAIWP